MAAFWSTDQRFAEIAPHRPTDSRGKERVDDRRVIRGIAHVLKSGGRRADAPREIYGPKKPLTDRFCRPLAFLVTGGQEADGRAGARLLERSPACRIVLADKGYDSDAIPRQIEATGAAANMPPKSNRRWKSWLSLSWTRHATPLSGCSGVSKTSATSPRDTTDWPFTPWRPVCIAATVSDWL